MSTVAEALQIAVQCQKANNLEQARSIYQEILAFQPSHPDALHGLSMVAQQQGQYLTAENLLNSLLQMQPSSFKAWFSLGNVHQTQGHLQEAVEAYQQALELQPKAFPIFNNLGYVFQIQGKVDEAIDCYQQALQIQPNLPEAEANLANALYSQNKLSPEQHAHCAALNYDLGIKCHKAGDFKTAVAYYRQAIAVKPDWVDAHYSLAVILQEQGDLEEAIACSQKVLELNPSHGEAYFNLGKIYQKQEQLQEAASAYRQGLKLINPHYAAAVETHHSGEFVPEDYTSPELQLGEVTVGDYQFPAIPPVPETLEKRPFFSVIIPLYNRKKYLLECLASVLAQWQGEEEMEILVMDNASNPPLFELVNAIGGGIVRYYLNSENIGPRRNFNRGIALSRGHWIHLLPEDEYVLPDYYSRLKQGLEGCPDSVGAAFTGYENIDETGKVIFTQTHHGMQRGINQNWLRRIGVSNPLNPCATVIRRAAHERLGAYDLINLYTPDWELYKRIASYYDWWCEPEVSARYRQHSNNMSSEVFLAGAQGEYYRLGIEISESYLPIEDRAEITAKARRRYFDLCLNQAVVPLAAGNITGVFRLIQEALKIDSSPQAIEKLFSWLTKNEAAPLRDEIAGKLRSISLEDTAKSFYFAYP